MDETIKVYIFWISLLNMYTFLKNSSSHYNSNVIDTGQWSLP